MSTMRVADRLPNPARVVGWTMLLAIAFLSLNYMANGYLQTIDKAPVRESLRTAFANGDLDVIKSRTDDDVMGVHQTTDCLVWDIAARDSTDTRLYLFSAAYTAPQEVGRGKGFGLCDALRDWLIADPMQTFGETWYIRYLFGNRLVADALLLNVSVADARVIMKAASYGILLLAIGLNLIYAVTAAGGRIRETVASSNFGYAVLAAGVMGFFGLPYFGQAITHAPPIVVIGLFIIGWSTLDRFGRLTARAGILACIVFGLFTAYFEFMTGYVPVGCCLIIAMVAIAFGTRPGTRPWTVIHYLILCGLAFVGAVLAAALINVALTAVFTDRGFEVISLFWNQLTSRMARTAPATVAGATDINPLTLGDVLYALLESLSHLSGLSQRAMAGVLVASVSVCAFVAYDTLFRRGSPTLRLSTALAAASFLPVCLWVFAFQNHTAIHAAFMVRILVVIPVAGLVAAWSWTRLVLVSQPALLRTSSTLTPPPLAALKGA